MKYGFMTFSTPQDSLEEVLQKAAKYGYAGIEIRISANHAHGIEPGCSSEVIKNAKALSKKYGVEFGCVATGLRFADTAKFTVQHAKECIALASALGSPFIRVFGGSDGGIDDRKSAIDTAVANLLTAADYAKQNNVIMCFETHDDWCDPNHVKSVIVKANHPNVMVNWDILHPIRYGFSVEESYELLKDYICHVHIHDNTVNDDKQFEYVPMGEGIVDNKTAITLLKKAGYDGLISGEWINWSPADVHLPHEISVMKSYE